MTPKTAMDNGDAVERVLTGFRVRIAGLHIDYVFIGQSLHCVFQPDRLAER